MIVKNNTNQAIERHKSKLGLTGDVYVINGFLIESLESHKKLIPSSIATTIEDAELERFAYEHRRKELLKELNENAGSEE